MIGEIGERMPERCQFPIEHGDDPRLGWVENEIVAAEVAMDDCHPLRILRPGSFEPRNQTVHVRVTPRRRIGQILLGKPLDLAFDIARRAAEPAEPDARGVQRVEIRDRRIHSPEIFGPFTGFDVGKGGVPEYPPFDQFHQVEHRTDDIGIDAGAVDPGHGHTCSAERGLHHSFAVDGVGPLQKHPRWLPPKDIRP